MNSINKIMSLSKYEKLITGIRIFQHKDEKAASKNNNKKYVIADQLHL